MHNPMAFLALTQIKEGNENSQKAICNSMCTSMNNELLLWHYRMVHPNFKYLNIYFYICSIDFYCESCELIKHQNTPFPNIQHKSSKTIIHNSQ